MQELKVTGKDIVNEFISHVQEGSEHIIDIARETLGEGKGDKLTFAMQKRQLQPEQPKPLVRKESPKRAHKFYSVGSFVDYLLKYKTQNTVVLADVEKNTIAAVLDEKADKGFEVIEFQPQIHPLFAPWQHRIIGKELEIKGFALFLQQNKKTILSPDAKELTMFFSQIRASQKINMHKGIGNGSINGLTCELTIMGKHENQEVELPETIKLNVPVYIDTPEQEIDVDIILAASNTEVLVCCSSSGLDVHKVKAFEGMISKVREVEGLVVGFGSVDTEEWEYLR